MPYRGDGVSTGPLSDADLDRLGLLEARDRASARAGRPVNFMLYQSMDDAVARKPSIRVWF
jgi:hypothetical protein